MHVESMSKWRQWARRGQDTVEDGTDDIEDGSGRVYQNGLADWLGSAKVTLRLCESAEASSLCYMTGISSNAKATTVY
jgi:hypothetical protein